VTVDDVDPSIAPPSAGLPSTTRRFANHLVELPGGVVEFYLRDPAGNLVEIDHHGVDRLPVTWAPRSRASGSSTPGMTSR